MLGVIGAINVFPRHHRRKPGFQLRLRVLIQRFDEPTFVAGRFNDAVDYVAM